MDGNGLTPASLFAFCPRCGRDLPPRSDPKCLDCPKCGLRYYFNPTVAAAAFVRRPDGRVLLIRRAREPAMGKLAPPGGFIDEGETVEEALRREVREEVGLSLKRIEFLTSRPNSYRYREVVYPVLDLFFTAEADSEVVSPDLHEVASAEWLNPADVSPDDMAFVSTRAAFIEYLRRAGH